MVDLRNSLLMIIVYDEKDKGSENFEFMNILKLKSYVNGH